jgi:phosphotransferase system enzyme I (PtsP)
MPPGAGRGVEEGRSRVDAEARAVINEAEAQGAQSVRPAVMEWLKRVG